MSDSPLEGPPSPFIARWCVELSPLLPPPRRALDIAMGRGRHVETLARSGYRVFGVDVSADAVRSARARAVHHGFVVHAWIADLTRYPLPQEYFELVVVSRYLQRDLFPALGRSLAPGGAILYETFTEAQRVLGSGPTSPNHLLAAGELRGCFDGFEVMFYEEVSAPEAMARIVARRPLTHIFRGVRLPLARGRQADPA